MFGFLRAFFVMVFVVTLSACSSSGSLTMTSGGSVQDLPASPTLRLVVNPVVGDSDEVLSDVRSAILSQLMATGRYTSVVTAPVPTDLVITVDIVKYSKVSVGERLLVGLLAGKNRVHTDVKITRTSNGALVKSFHAEGNSAAHPLSSESGISDAIREVAKEVASGAIV